MTIKNNNKFACGPKLTGNKEITIGGLKIDISATL